MKLHLMKDANIVIVQLLGGNKANKALVQEAVLNYCNKKKINVVVRHITKAQIVKNFDYAEMFIKDFNK